MDVKLLLVIFIIDSIVETLCLQKELRIPICNLRKGNVKRLLKTYDELRGWHYNLNISFTSNGYF